MVWLAAAAEPLSSSGDLWFDRRPVPTHLVSSTRETPGDRDALWRGLVEIVGEDLDMARGAG